MSAARSASWLALKAVTSASLAYATYTAVTCPCDTYLACHKEAVLATTGFAFFVALMA